MIGFDLLVLALCSIALFFGLSTIFLKSFLRFVIYIVTIGFKQCKYYLFLVIYN